MKSILTLLLIATVAKAEIGLISPAEAKKLIENPDASQRPIVLDTRGGYKDYFRGHLPTAHHINFDTLRGTNEAVPVQYLPDDITKALLIRAGADKDRLHLVYATSAALPNLPYTPTSLSPACSCPTLCFKRRRALPALVMLAGSSPVPRHPAPLNS